MVYAQYCRPNGEHETGNRSIAVLDARRSMDQLHADAIAMNGYLVPFYSAYRLFKGASLLRSQPISGLKFLRAK
jgi:hypothetical protein